MYKRCHQKSTFWATLVYHAYSNEPSVTVDQIVLHFDDISVVREKGKIKTISNNLWFSYNNLMFLDETDILELCSSLE